MSKRVTPKQQNQKRTGSGKKRRSTSLSAFELVSQRAGIERKDLPRVLANAVDDDPFEIIGLASIAASTLQHNVGRLFDEFADQDPRLGPVLWATVARLPFVDGFARPERIIDDVLPDWLINLNDAKVTGIMRRVTNDQHDWSSYLVEVTMVNDLVATCVFDLDHRGPADIGGFCTVAAPMIEVAEHYETKFQATCDRTYENTPLPEGVQNLLMALDESLNDQHRRTLPRPPWPANMPVALLVLDMAMSQIRGDDLPYTALRRTTSGRNPKAKTLRRSRATWPNASPSR